MESETKITVDGTQELRKGDWLRINSGGWKTRMLVTKVSDTTITCKWHYTYEPWFQLYFIWGLWWANYFAWADWYAS